MATIVGTLGNDTVIDFNNADDEIFGDALGTVNVAAGSDRIFGRGGADTISGDATTVGPLGTGGNDTVQGGDGDDTIFGDAGGSLFGIGGNDTLFQNAGFGLLVGDADTIEAGAQGGNDKLFGDRLVGDSDDAMVSATGGNDLLDASGATAGSVLYGDVFDTDLDGTSVGGRDTLKGSAFRDFLVGEGFNLNDASRGGDDILRGNGGDDFLSGDADFAIRGSAVGGDDTLLGGAGNDEIFGDADHLEDFATGGADRIFGGPGDDELWGDGELFDDATGGADRFVFAGGFGDDTINDFRQGEDTIVFQGFEPSDFQITIEGGTDTLLTSLGDDSLRLAGFTDPLVFGVDVIFA